MKWEYLLKQNKMIKVKDLQFPSYFLNNEIQLRSETIQQLLNVDIIISYLGEPDTVCVKNKKLIVTNPSSITRFLFMVLYNLLKETSNEGAYEDKLSLGLLYACKDYTFSDFEEHRSPCPSAFISLDKLPLISTLLHEIIEPLVGKLALPSILYAESTFVDAARIVDNENQFSKEFNVPHRTISFHDYPFILVNENVHNRPAQTAHLFYKILEISYGTSKASQIIRNILLDEESDILGSIIDVVKILHGEPGFIFDFLKFFESNAILSQEESRKVADSRIRCVNSDSYLREHIKVGQKHSPQVFKQWHQWSMITGLIEKQLGPMRGSMWPTTEKLKPIEDIQRQMIVDRAKKKGKTQLNFEELLEVAREIYGHKAYQPGQLYENLLRKNRIWKT